MTLSSPHQTASLRRFSLAPTKQFNYLNEKFGKNHKNKISIQLKKDPRSEKTSIHKQLV
jgi:hypothetical protein